MHELLSEFTWHAFVVKVLWTISLTVLTRFLMWVFRVTRIRERWYWVAVPLLVFCALTVIHGLAGGGNNVDIRPRAEFVDIGAVAELKDYPALLVIMSVRNVGMPTVLEGWTAEITMPTGKPLVMLPYQFPGTITLDLAAHYGNRAYTKADSLYLKGLTPIARGAMVRGILTYVPPAGVTRQDLLAGKHAKIHIFDVTGEEHTVDISWENARGEVAPPVFPDLGPQ
jgi:hypothetical protein